jgi:hypothetical protein
MLLVDFIKESAAQKSLDPFTRSAEIGTGGGFLHPNIALPKFNSVGLLWRPPERELAASAVRERLARNRRVGVVQEFAGDRA